MIITEVKFKGIKEFITGWRIVFFIPLTKITEDLKINIIQALNSEGWLTFSNNKLKTDVEAIMKNRKIGINEEGKSRSALMRGELYRFWLNGYKGKKSFEEFYEAKMDDYITRIKQVNDQIEIDRMDESYGINNNNGSAFNPGD